MLIGSYVPKLLEPWEIVNSCGEGPYATKTMLGWVINGPVQGSDTNNPEAALTVAVVNRICLQLEGTGAQPVDGSACIAGVKLGRKAMTKEGDTYKQTN